MIRKYTIDDRHALCEFFSSLIEIHKEYISHGELQMGIATDRGQLAKDYKTKWLQYLDRQSANPENTILLYEEKGKIIGFTLFGITNDGAQPYGVIFDLGVAPACRGKHIGQQLLTKALDCFKALGIQNCYLESGIDNHSAHGFFRKNGFSAVSEIFRLKL
ncbi:GNAT family N-acetyltransferase [uncultured Odoribacter sp.]|uniref:GNAT family N-acetyltransferase n=1 Tax=uncultured Odoribacter sp. TaxID=876416 RepID=UPI0026155453|nr:GNAT family N-acetyltransferase [uncultured Odoribacter sp.]